MERKMDLFAVVKLNGQSRIAGKVSEHAIGSTTFIQIDVPDTRVQPRFSRLINPTAIYSIIPVTEEVMRKMAEQISARPFES